MLELQRAAVADDVALVGRIQRGDRAAFDVLVRRYLKVAFGAAYRILGQREDTEDVVQEAFVAALEHIDSFDTTRAFKPWLLRIVVNRAINARQYRERRATEGIPEHTAAATPPPTALVEQHEMQECVQRALARLTDRQRTIVQLSGFDGINSGEIGELLHIPAGTVRWELHQARGALRIALATCRGM